MKIPVYSVYVNTMIFTIVSGVLSLILLLALVYVPTVGEYAVLILTVQFGLLAIIVQALVRLWWSQRKRDLEAETSVQNTLAVNFCPDYMVASVDGKNDVVCKNEYPLVAGATNPTNIWTDSQGNAIATIPLSGLTDMRPNDAIAAQLEAHLRREDGPSTILVIGERMSGKTTICEGVLRKMGRHIVRWTPYEAFTVGRVEKAFSDSDTVVFVDDADVLVRLTKGSSVGLIEALQHCKLTPRIRIILTALDTKGRVWRAVAGCADVVVTIPPREVCIAVRKARPVFHDWGSVLRASERAIASRMMKNWCAAREADEEEGQEAGKGGTQRATHLESDPITSVEAGDSDGCVVWKVAELLVR